MMKVFRQTLLIALSVALMLSGVFIEDQGWPTDTAMLAGMFLMVYAVLFEGESYDD